MVTIKEKTQIFAIGQLVARKNNRGRIGIVDRILTNPKHPDIAISVEVIVMIDNDVSTPGSAARTLLRDTWPISNTDLWNGQLLIQN